MRAGRQLFGSLSAMTYGYGPSAHEDEVPSRVAAAVRNSSRRAGAVVTGRIRSAATAGRRAAVAALPVPAAPGPPPWRPAPAPTNSSPQSPAYPSYPPPVPHLADLRARGGPPRPLPPRPPEPPTGGIPDRRFRSPRPATDARPAGTAAGPGPPRRAAAAGAAEAVRRCPKSVQLRNAVPGLIRHLPHHKPWMVALSVIADCSRARHLWARLVPVVQGRPPASSRCPRP